MSFHLMDIGCTEGQLLKAGIWPASNHYFTDCHRFVCVIGSQLETERGPIEKKVIVEVVAIAAIIVIVVVVVVVVVVRGK